MEGEARNRDTCMCNVYAWCKSDKNKRYSQHDYEIIYEQWTHLPIQSSNFPSESSAHELHTGKMQEIVVACVLIYICGISCYFRIYFGTCTN